MTDALNNWRVYCTTESAYITIWKSETDSVPTTCPNNTAHTINSSLTRIVDTRSSTLVSVKQEGTATGGHYRWHSFQFTALANQTTTQTFTFPMGITVLSALMNTGDEMRGDVCSWIVSKNTTVGALTADVSIGDTVIHVSPTVVAYVSAGFKVNLINYPSTTTDLGYVSAVDKVNNTLTLAVASTAAYAAATPTYVRMSIMFLDKVEMGWAGRLEIGESKIMGTYVPAGTVVAVEYINYDYIDKRIVANIEFLY